LARGYPGEVVFLHYARSPGDVIFGAELQALAKSHPNLKLVIETEAERGALPDLNEQSLSALVPAFERWDAWVCGPQGLMDAATRAYAARGAEARVRTEQFVVASQLPQFEGEAGHLYF